MSRLSVYSRVAVRFGETSKVEIALVIAFEEHLAERLVEFRSPLGKDLAIVAMECADHRAEERGPRQPGRLGMVREFLDQVVHQLLVD